MFLNSKIVISRFEESANGVVLDCPLTCFDGSDDLHDQDGKWVWLFSLMYLIPSFYVIIFFFFFFLTAERRLVNFCVNIASWPLDIFPKKG